MKGNRQSYVTIEEIVDGVCLDLGEGNHRKEQYLRWAIQEAQRWKMDMAKEVKTVKLDLTDWKSIVLPSDCIDWIKIGIQDGDVIKTFVNRNDTAIYHDLDPLNVKVANPDPVSLLQTDLAGYTVPFYNYSGWQDSGKIFGQIVKENQFGYFTVNRNDNSDEIQFRTKVDSTSKIYLEYLADGFNPNSQSLVHPYAEELVTLGIHYRRLKFNKTESRQMVAEAKRDYQEEYYRVIDRIWDYSIEDITETLNNGYGLTARPQH
jgi:hypothetical protein